MKTILTLSAVYAFTMAFAIAQPAKVALPRPASKISATTKIASNLPHVALRLPNVQQPSPKSTVTIHESKNPAKVSKTVVKAATKHTPAPVAAKPKVSAPQAETAPEEVATTNTETPRVAVKKYSRRTVSAPPRHTQTANQTAVIQSEAPAAKPAAKNEEAPAENWLSESFSLDANGNKVEPYTAPAVVEEAPAARPVARKEAQVESAFYGAHYQFDTETINYGTIAKGSNGKRKFTFRNDGSEPLIISSIIPGCSCVTADAPKDPIAPGKTGFIEVEYDTTQEGDFLKDFVISSNVAGEEAVKIVYIKGHVR